MIGAKRQESLARAMDCFFKRISTRTHHHPRKNHDLTKIYTVAFGARRRACYGRAITEVHPQPDRDESREFERGSLLMRWSRAASATTYQGPHANFWRLLRQSDCLVERELRLTSFWDQRQGQARYFPDYYMPDPPRLFQALLPRQVFVVDVHTRRCQ